MSKHLQEASNSLVEAIEIGTDEKTKAFLLARSQSYEQLINVNNQNIDIIRETLDESITDMNTVVDKVLSIAASRDADQKAADEAVAAADTILKRS